MNPLNRWFRALVGLILAACVGHAWACTSVEGIPVFAPDVKAETDQWILANARDWAGPLRAIDAHVESIRRAEPNDMCDPSTSIKVRVAWAEQTATRLEDVGIYFKIVSGTGGLGPVDYAGLNDLPRVVLMEDGIAYVYLRLPDSASATRGPVDLDVEVFAVDKLLHIGPSTRLRIRSVE